MRFLLAAVAALAIVCVCDASDKRNRVRAVYAYESTMRNVSVASVTENKPFVFGESSLDALNEVNAERAKRGLPPFKNDPLLNQAAQSAAKKRAANFISGHLASDFDELPAGARADAAGCGALEPSWGWGSCCTFDDYTHAGAAWVMGSDGKRYMHLFVRREAATVVPTTEVQRVADTPAIGYSAESCSTGSCGVSSSYQPRRFSIFRGRR